MAAVPLPAGIDEKLSDLAAEMRRLRVIRGASWAALAVFALAVAAIAVDSSVPMPRYARLLALGGWVALGALAAWAFVYRRATGDIPAADLAAAIEEKYPSLAERLRTLVELSESAEPGNGSKALIALLGRETEKRTQKLNFFRAAPTGGSFRTAAAALALGMVAVVLIFFVRWYTPPVEAAFTVAVSSGDPVVKRGEPVTLTAFLKKTKPTATLPDAAVLVFREPGTTAETKLPMAGDDKAAFSVTRPKVSADFEYAVECGGIRTDWHTVSAVDPVEVAAGSSTTATAPEYVVADPVQKRDGLTEIEVMQHGTVAYELKFTRPAADGKVEWRPADAKAEQVAESLPLAFADDKRSATYTHPATADGTLKFVLIGEKGVKTEAPVAVRAVADAPPRFEKVTGLPLGVNGLRDVRPDRPLKFDLAVSDDVSVSKVVVEYARWLGDKAGETKTEAVPLAGLNTRRAEGVFFFSLQGKANDGEIVRVRLRVTDKRSVPAANLAPQSTTFPENDWATLRLSNAAAPISEQEINGQKEKIEAKLDAVAKKLDAAKKDVEAVKKEADGKEKLEVDQLSRLDAARTKARDAARDLDDVARDAEVVPDLRQLGQAAREVADKHLRPAEDELRKAANEPDITKRTEEIAAANDELAKAKAAVDELRKKNAAAARSRMSQEKLKELADDQDQLRKDAADADPAKAAELAAKQKELRDRLDQLLKEDPDIKKAAEKANAQDAAALAEDAARLKRQQEELDAAARASADRGKQQSADALRKKQADLAAKAAELKKKTDTAARVGDVPPLDPKPAADAADKMTGDKPLDALTEQEKAARELDRLADKLAAEAGKRGDAKDAAAQIAKWQDDLRRRADAAKQTPDARKKLQAEQKAIQKATERLALPPSDALQQAQKDAAAKAGAAPDALGTPDADAALKKAADALAKLAEQTPSNADRRAAAKSELEKLRREQDAVAKEAADAVKGVEGKNPDDPATRDELAKKLKTAADKQDELAKKLKQLDAPGMEQRRDRTADAAQRAADDLRNGLPQDIPASQADAKRREDRLRDALNGDTPADDKASQLAREQRQLTDELTKLEKPSADDLQRLQRRQKEINKQLAELKAPEAAGEKSDARDAAHAADAALGKKEPEVDELRKKSKAAAAAAQKLADKMAGESDEDKLDRLAKNRAEQAKKAGEPVDPGSDLSRTRDAQQQLDRDAADLAGARAGDAQAAKKKAADALERLRRTPEPDQQKELQKQAADAMKDLADQVRKNGDRKGGNELASEPKRDPADATDPDNGLATEEQAKAARDLAKQQRGLRDELSKNAERNAKGPPKPSANDPLGDFAKQQAEIARQADELAKKADADAQQPSQAAAAAAKQAADKLAAGDATAAEKAGQDAAEKLKQAADKAGTDGAKKEAGDLAKKQDELNGKVAEAGQDPGAAAARQQRRQQELAQDAKELADKLDRAAERQENSGTPMPMGAGEKMKQAADQARKAGEQMERAGQEAKAGKSDRAADAAKQANDNLKQAADAAKQGAGSPMPNGKPGDGQQADAGKAAQQAGDKMAQAQGRLGKGPAGTPGAQQAMKDAADKLKQAADRLAQAGQPGQPGDGPGGNEPGMNTGAGNKPNTEKVPSAVIENLGKSWGDLSGEVKSKILQELSAKYGEDYAKAIKLYFEQLADRK